MTGWSIYNNRPQLVRTVYIVVLMLVLALSSTWLVRFATITTDQNRYRDVDGKVVIKSIEEGGVSDRAGLKVGDAIVKINGNPVKGMVDANNYLVESSGGDVLEYTIERDGKILVKSIITADFGLPLYYIALVVTGLAFLLIGSWVILKRPQYPAARLFGWANIPIALALIMSMQISRFHYPDTLTILGSILRVGLWPIALSVYMHLLLYFPCRRFARPVPVPMYVLIYVLPVSVLMLSVFVLNFVFHVSGIGGLIVFALLFASVTAVQIILARNMKNTQRVEYRERSRPILAAIGFGILYTAAMSLVGRHALWQAAFFGGVAVPALLFRSIIHQRIFDLYVVIRRGSLYNALSAGFHATLLALFIAILVMLPSRDPDLPVINISGGRVEVIQLKALSEERRETFERRIFLVTGMLLAVGFWWTYRKGKRVLDRRFYRASLDYRRALSAFSKLSHSHFDRLSLAETVVKDLTALMHVKSAAFLSYSDGKLVQLADNRLSAGNEMMSLDEQDLEHLKPYLEKNSCVAVDNLPLRDRFREAGVEFLTAVLRDGEIEALLLLGEKQSETNYTREDIELLEALTTNVGDALMTMRFYDAAREKERMRKELEVARSIQLASLPAELPELPGMDIAAHSQPALEVGGDFYDFLPRYDSTTFIIGDVSGKGTSAALYLARIQGIIRTIESYQPTLWELFVRLNTQIFDHIERRSYLTMAGLRVDLLKNEVCFLRAGHLPLLHFNALSREVVLHQPAGMGVGLDHHLFGDQLEESSIFTRGGDILVLLSDGMSEAMNEKGEELGLEGISDCIAQHADSNAQEILEALFTLVGRYTGSTERHDDATAVVIKFAISHEREPRT
ncbi:SpoIIE family protein phosphatase [bacterium]|nr:SpoIIE family protein phosphatase [bacterium]